MLFGKGREWVGEGGSIPETCSAAATDDNRRTSKSELRNIPFHSQLSESSHVTRLSRRSSNDKNYQLPIQVLRLSMIHNIGLRVLRNSE